MLSEVVEPDDCNVSTLSSSPHFLNYDVVTSPHTTSVYRKP